MTAYFTTFGISLLALVLVERWSYMARPKGVLWEKISANDRRIVEWPFGDKWQSVVDNSIKPALMEYRKRQRVNIICRYIFIAVWISVSILAKFS